MQGILLTSLSGFWQWFIPKKSPHNTYTPLEKDHYLNKRGPSWKATSSSDSQKFHRFSLNSKGYHKVPTTNAITLARSLSYMDHNRTHHLFNRTVFLSCTYLQSSPTKTQYYSRKSPMRATRPTHLSPLTSVTVPMQRTLQFMHLHVVIFFLLLLLCH